MDSDKSLELDLAMVSSSDPTDSICSSTNSPRKRICDDDDDDTTDLVDLQVKKSRIDDGTDRDSVMVVELAPLMNDASNLMTNKDDKTPVNTPGAEYFEFIKSQTDDFSGHTSQLIDGINNKSPSQNGPNDNGDREGLSTGQQYYIAVDARTVATLQAGAEYTLVPVDQGGKGPTDERPGSFDDESCQMWSGGDTSQLKENDQPQQMMIQTMRPLSSNPSSPQMYCQEMGEENRDANMAANTQHSDTEGLNANGNVYSNIDGVDNTTSSRKMIQSLPPSSQMQGNVKYDNTNRFQTPTSSNSAAAAAAGYPVMSAPPPHMMYNVPSGGSHHQNNPQSFGYAGHRVHLPPPGPAWHSSPYSQSYSPHNTPGFAQNQPVTQPPTMNLSSSGEEQENVSPEYPRFSQNEANSDGNLFPISAIQRTPNMAGILGPLDNMQYFPIPYTGRENHNEKERKRRSRIKNACSLLRDLVPGLSEKTDKATVFEYTVQYLLHLKRHVGKQFDKEFMEKYTPY